MAAYTLFKRRDFLKVQFKLHLCLRVSAPSALTLCKGHVRVGTPTQKDLQNLAGLWHMSLWSSDRYPVEDPSPSVLFLQRKFCA